MLCLYINYFNVDFIMKILKQHKQWVLHAEQEMLTLPEHLISPLVFIEVHVALSFVSPYFLL